MKKTGQFLSGAADVLSGKHGVLLLTVINVCAVLFVITISGKWGCYLDSNYSIEPMVMTLYLIDYRAGFISRALIGSIFGLFTQHITDRMVSHVLFVAALIAVLLYSFIQAILVKKALRVKDHATMLLSYLLFLNGFFWFNAFNTAGLVDIFMNILLALFLLCLESAGNLRYWLAPVVCFIGLLIHTAFFFTGVPVICAILWFDMLREGKPDRFRLSFLTLTCVVSIVLIVLFVFCTRQLVRMDEDALFDMMRKKYDGEVYTIYFRGYLYLKYEEMTEQSVSEVIRVMHNRVLNTSVAAVQQFLPYLSPVLAFYYWGVLYQVRHSTWRKIAYLGFLAPFVSVIPILYLSTDGSRFLCHYLFELYMILHSLSMQTEAALLPNAETVPKKKLSRYEQKRRSELIRKTLIAGVFVGAAYLLYGQLKF